MADPYIDNFETLAYGAFAVDQIKSLVLALDPDFTQALSVVSARLAAATEGMRAALARAGQIDVVTYKPLSGGPDRLAEARSILRRLASYVDSRAGGEAILHDLFGDDAPSTVVRRRPAKLAGALTHALDGLARHASELPEHATWIASLTSAKAALDELNTSVRQSRSERRDATPEIAAARGAWFTAYAAAKLIVEAVLRYQDKIRLLPEIFDDLAEVHRAPGVSDGDSATEPAPAHPT